MKMFAFYIAWILTDGIETNSTFVGRNTFEESEWDIEPDCAQRVSDVPKIAHPGGPCPKGKREIVYRIMGRQPGLRQKPKLVAGPGVSKAQSYSSASLKKRSGNKHTQRTFTSDQGY